MDGGKRHGRKGDAVKGLYEEDQPRVRERCIPNDAEDVGQAGGCEKMMVVVPVRGKDGEQMRAYEERMMLAAIKD